MRLQQLEDGILIQVVVLAIYVLEKVFLLPIDNLLETFVFFQEHLVLKLLEHVQFSLKKPGRQYSPLGSLSVQISIILIMIFHQYKFHRSFIIFFEAGFQIPF